MILAKGSSGICAYEEDVSPSGIYLASANRHQAKWSGNPDRSVTF